MINTISGNMPMGGMQIGGTPPPPKQEPLTEEQTSLIEEILAEYDPESLSAEDAASIVKTFEEAGIQPGRKLAEAMADAGFDARTVGELAGVGPQQHPAQQAQGNEQAMTLNISEEMLSQLNELLTDYYSEDQSDEQRQNTLSAIRDIFQQTAPEGGLINVTA